MRRSGVRAPPGEFCHFFANISNYTRKSFPGGQMENIALIYMKCSISPTGPMPRVLSCEMMNWKQRQQNVLQAEDLFNKDTKIFSCCSTTGSACQEISLRTKLPSCFWLWFCTLPEGEFIKNKVNKHALFEIQLWANETKNWQSQRETIERM